MEITAPFIKLIIYILSNLLHRANREYCNQYFYKIKNRILERYGTHRGYDVQFIEGKQCHACDGTGIYTHYRYSKPTHESCYRCYAGWYKRPEWNILERVQVGKYTFHKPYQRAYKKPETIPGTLIEGYISHKRAKYGATCMHLLFLFYEKGYVKRWYKSAGIGWFTRWWLPATYLPNLAHIIKRGRQSYPYKQIAGKLFRLTHSKEEIKQLEDLPF